MNRTERKKGKSWDSRAVRIFGDSSLTLNQVTGRWACNKRLFLQTPPPLHSCRRPWPRTRRPIKARSWTAQPEWSPGLPDTAAGPLQRLHCTRGTAAGREGRVAVPVCVTPQLYVRVSKNRAHPDSNQGPFGLQPNALPLSYRPFVKVRNRTQKKNTGKQSGKNLLPSGIEPLISRV